jgi:hypothetical protein
VKRTLLVIPLLLAALLVLPTSPAWACSCVALTTAQAVAHADVVLSGTLEEVDQPRGLVEPSSGAPAQSYRFAVSEVYEGSAPATSWVGSAQHGASCGLEGLEPGREYVVFAQERGDTLWASLCGGTGVATSGLVSEVEAVAGPGRDPVGAGPLGAGTTAPLARPAGATAPAGERAWQVPLAGGLLLALGLAGALVVVVRRGRRRG